MLSKVQFETEFDREIMQAIVNNRFTVVWQMINSITLEHQDTKNDAKLAQPVISLIKQVYSTMTEEQLNSLPKIMKCLYAYNYRSSFGQGRKFSIGDIEEVRLIAHDYPAQQVNIVHIFPVYIENDKLVILQDAMGKQAELPELDNLDKHIEAIKKSALLTPTRFIFELGALPTLCYFALVHMAKSGIMQKQDDHYILYPHKWHDTIPNIQFNAKTMLRKLAVAELISFEDARIDSSRLIRFEHVDVGVFKPMIYDMIQMDIDRLIKELQ